jgi:nicotinamidase-related amidase
MRSAEAEPYEFAIAPESCALVIAEELHPVVGQRIIDKPGKSAFHATDLDAVLKNRALRRPIRCGVVTEGPPR